MSLDPINGIIEGEIIKAQPRRDGEGNPVFYTCRVFMPHGGIATVVNVKESSLFGGINDYHRRRARTRTNSDYPNGVGEQYRQHNMNASVGERVYIAFINGSMNHGVIIGYAQHPNQVDDFFDNPDQMAPCSVKQLNGVREVINETGGYIVTRKGAPGVNFLPNAQTNIGGFAGDGSAALLPAPPSERVIMEMAEGGVWGVRDSAGGVIEVSKSKDGVYISSNGNTSSTESGGVVNSVGGDYIRVSRSGLVRLHAMSSITIVSHGSRSDHTYGNDSYQIDGNTDWNVGGDQTVVAGGAITIGCGGEYLVAGSASITLDAGANLEMVSGADAAIQAGGLVDLSAGGDFDITGGGAFSVISSGMSLSSNGNELLTEVVALMTQVEALLDGLAAETHTGNLGFSTSPPVNVGTYTGVKAAVSAVKAKVEAMQ